MRRWIAHLRPLVVVAGIGPWLAGNGLPPGKAAEREIEVRAYDHRDFGRVALEWATPPIKVEAVPGSDMLTLRLSRPFRGDLSGAADRLQPYLRAAAPGPAADAIVLHLRPGTRYKLFTVEDRIAVIDLFRGDASHTPQLPPVQVRTGRHEGYVRIVFDLPAAADHRVEREGDRVAIRFDEPARIDAPAIARALAPLVAAAEAEADGEATRLVLRVPPAARVRDFALPDNRVVLDIFEPAPAPAAGAPEIHEPASQARALNTSSPREQGTEPPAAAPQPPSLPVPSLAMGSAAVEDGIELRFDWNVLVPAAVFQRAGYLWTVFGAVPEDAERVIQLLLRAGDDPALSGVLGPGEVIPAEGALALRFPLRRDVEAAVARDGDRWRVVLRDDAPPARPLVPRRLADPPRLFFPGADTVVRLADPEVGDHLYALPLPEGNRGQPRPRRLVDLRLLATAQGIAWLPSIDELRVRAVEGGVEVGTPDGLRLTVRAEESRTNHKTVDDMTDHRADAGAATAYEAARGTEPVTGSGPSLGLTTVASEPGQSTLALRRRLVEHVLSVPPAQRDAARLDLARFLLSRALAAETLAVLGAIEVAAGDDGGGGAPAMALSRNGLAGAARLLMGRIRDAEAGLTAKELDDDPEVALWRAMLAAADGDWPGAARELKRSGQTLDGYPPQLRVRLGLTAALIALESGQPDTAFSVLKGLKDLATSPHDRARLRFTEGLALARDGATTAAEQAWRELAATAPAETRQKALYAMTALLLETGRIGADEALAKLEAARPFWRGHPWEITMLDGLARMYAGRRDYHRALATWKEAVTRRPEAPEAEAIAQAMGDLFVTALTAEGEDAPSALQVAGLYLDFPELTPDGAAGDRLSRRLAERLAELDLVEDAAAVLERQIRHRLKGPAKAEAGVYAGELWLREPAPEAALETLRASATDARLPVDLQRRRRLLEARALAAQGRSDEAITALQGDTSRPARFLRAAIHFERREWPQVLEAASGLLPEHTDDPEASLGPEERDLVVRLALARAQLGDREALGALRERFGAAMAGSPEHATFAVAVGGPDREARGGPEAILTGSAGQLDAVRTFLDGAAEG